jgi:hypothetical protein
LNWHVSIGNIELRDQPTMLRTELQDAEFRTVIQVLTAIVAELPVSKETRTGTLLDVDTLCPVEYQDLAAFRAELPDRLQSLRGHNKTSFFSCLQQAAIDAMGPTYE